MLLHDCGWLHVIHEYHGKLYCFCQYPIPGGWLAGAGKEWYIMLYQRAPLNIIEKGTIVSNGVPRHDP